MTRTILLGAAAALFGTSCLSDCTVVEATGLLEDLGKAGCSSSALLEDNGALSIGIDVYGGNDKLVDELRVIIPPPIVVGLRGSGPATVGNGAIIDQSFGGGVADYLITGVRLKDGTKDPYVDVDISCPHIEGKGIGPASFKGHATVLVVDLGHL